MQIRSVVRRDALTGIVCACALLSSATSAAATTFEVDGESVLCQSVLHHLKQTKNINRTIDLSGFKRVPFRSTRLSFQARANGEEFTESVNAARFDISNDGTPKIVVKYETWLGNSPGDVLWIFPATLSADLEFLPHLTSEEFARMASVEPMTPWPYADRGIWFANIDVLVLQGVTYLSLRDINFGDLKFPERRWLLAKYSGRTIPSEGFHKFTDDLKTVCSFRYGRSE